MRLSQAVGERGVIAEILVVKALPIQYSPQPLFQVTVSLTGSHQHSDSQVVRLMAVSPDWSLVRFIGIMSPQTRYKIAWLMPVAALVVLGTAWWVSFAPSESLQSLGSITPLNNEPAEFQTNATKRSTSAFSTGGTDPESRCARKTRLVVSSAGTTATYS